MSKLFTRVPHESSSRLQATMGQKQSMLLQWRQYESKIATRSAEQSESLKKSALLSKSAQKADTPTQVVILRLLSIICICQAKASIRFEFLCPMPCCAAIPAAMQVKRAVHGHVASPIQSRTTSPQRHPLAPAHTSGQLAYSCYADHHCLKHFHNSSMSTSLCTCTVSVLHIMACSFCQAVLVGQHASWHSMHLACDLAS